MTSINENYNIPVFTDAIEKLSRARMLCPGFPDTIYYLTDYLAGASIDKFAPLGLLYHLILARNDIKKGVNSTTNTPLPYGYIENARDIINEIGYFPQIIDILADREFAREFRQVCKECSNFEPSKLIVVDDSDIMNYPENVRIAVNYWANAIQKQTSGRGIQQALNLMFSAILTSKDSYDEKDIRTFKKTLAELIMKEYEKEGRVYLNVDDNTPCELLAKAGKTIDVNPVAGYPFNKWLTITVDYVTTGNKGEEGYTLWSNNQNKHAEL